MARGPSFGSPASGNADDSTFSVATRHCAAPGRAYGQGQGGVGHWFLQHRCGSLGQFTGSASSRTTDPVEDVARVGVSDLGLALQEELAGGP
jgi:hypothetical protein